VVLSAGGDGRERVSPTMDLLGYGHFERGGKSVSMSMGREVLTSEPLEG